MSRLKNAKNSIISFVIGIICIPAGLLLIYFDFFGKKDQWYSDTSYYSYATFFIGLACLLMAFEKKKKPTDEGPGESSKPGD